jgi:FKBP-type peptidyl-prolyl cis-trans isomerase
MQFTSPRFSTLACAAAGVLILAACSDAFQVIEEVIEETTFDPSLNVDLNSMTKTSSGLYYETITEGSGETAVAGNSVTVAYAGFLANGSSFDSGQFSFTLGIGQVVAGFDEGVTGMKVGGIRLIVFPSSLGYGSQAQGAIPGGSILIFRIELVSIN